jgi:2,4-dienoyl-CoA reductase (NADPH2)
MTLLDPLSIRGVTLRNRIVVSPMCQYSSVDGFADDWHLVHLGSRAAGGAALVFVEASAVTEQGRITPADMGIWDDAHIEPLARIARFIERMGAVPAIQLAHAGRKASCAPPFHGGKRLTLDEGGWEVIAPSPISFSDTDPLPRELDEAGILGVIDAFVAGTPLHRRRIPGHRTLAHGYWRSNFFAVEQSCTDRRLSKTHEPVRSRHCWVFHHAADVLFTRISALISRAGWGLAQPIEPKCSSPSASI